MLNDTYKQNKKQQQKKKIQNHVFPFLRLIKLGKYKHSSFAQNGSKPHSNIVSFNFSKKVRLDMSTE